MITDNNWGGQDYTGPLGKARWVREDNMRVIHSMTCAGVVQWTVTVGQGAPEIVFLGIWQQAVKSAKKGKA